MSGCKGSLRPHAKTDLMFTSGAVGFSPSRNPTECPSPSCCCFSFRADPTAPVLTGSPVASPGGMQESEPREAAARGHCQPTPRQLSHTAPRLAHVLAAKRPVRSLHVSPREPAHWSIRLCQPIDRILCNFQRSRQPEATTASCPFLSEVQPESHPSAEESPSSGITCTDRFPQYGKLPDGSSLSSVHTQ